MQPATSTTTTTTTAVPIRKAHPIRGILWGLLVGLGATVIAILLKVIPLDLVWAVMVLAGGILVGILWSTLGPAKKPKGDAPYRVSEVTRRPDWDAAGPVPPAPPVAPGLEPLHIQPLDVEPVDLESPATPTVPAETAYEPPAEPAPPVVDPPRSTDQPDQPDRPGPPPPPPPPPPG